MEIGPLRVSLFFFFLFVVCCSCCWGSLFFSLFLFFLSLSPLRAPFFLFSLDWGCILRIQQREPGRRIFFGAGSQ